MYNSLDWADNESNKSKPVCEGCKVLTEVLLSQPLPADFKKPIVLNEFEKLNIYERKQFIKVMDEIYLIMERSIAKDNANLKAKQKAKINNVNFKIDFLCPNCNKFSTEQLGYHNICQDIELVCPHCREKLLFENIIKSLDENKGKWS